MKTENMVEIAKWAKTTDLEEIVYKKDKYGFSFCEVYKEERGFKPYSNLINVNSPHIGIFRKSPLGKTLDIKEGDEVKKGDILGYVEVLKEYKEILSPENGIVRTICLEEGALADYSTPLFFIEKI
ncbi:MAG: acetyl-CoA carboxylase biotin carboxyl carrier protein subunit [Elusimicrobiota bacterium]